MITTLHIHRPLGRHLRVWDERAIKRASSFLRGLERDPMVEIIEHRLNLSGHSVCVHSENGTLREVVVSPPSHLDWDCSSPINEKERQMTEQGIMPNRHRAIIEWSRFVEELLTHNVRVTILTPHSQFLEGVYTRDPAFVVDSTLFIGRMHANVRKSETARYSNGGVKPPEGHNIIIEGGNVVLGRNCVFVGVGDRTTLEAVFWLQNQLGTSREVIPLQLRQGILHLDCVFGPHDSRTRLPSNLILDKSAFKNDGQINPAEFAAARAMYPPGPVIPPFKGLEEAFKRYPLQTVLTDAESNRLVPNMVMLHPELAIANFLPHRIKKMLETFMRVILLPLGELAKGDGSYRCATMPLNRID